MASNKPTPLGRPGAASGGRVSDFPVERKNSARTPWLGLGFLLSIVGAGFYFSTDADFLLGQVASITLGAFGLHGLWRGGLRKIVMLPVTVGSLFLVTAKPDFADPLIRSVTGQSSMVGNMLACGLALVATFLMTGALIRYVRNKVIVKRPVALGIDRFVGTTVGLAEGAVVLLVLCWTAVLTQPQMARLKDHPGTAPGSARQSVATTMLKIVGEIDEGPLRTLVRDQNLLKDIPAIKSAIEQIEQAASNPDFWNSSAASLFKGVDPKTLGEAGEIAERLKADTERRRQAYDRLPAQK